MLLVPLSMMPLLYLPTGCSLSPTALPAPFDLVGTSSKSICRNPLMPLQISPLTVASYYCHFLGRHPDDTSLPDPSSRWWLLWHRFTISSDDVIELGGRVLFNPSTNPNPASYIAWADVLPLLDPSICLLGPFSFTVPASNPPGRTSSFRQMIPFQLWSSLTITLCVSSGILPPVLSSPPTSRSRWTRSCRAS
jgi:hypothetical protein